MNLYNKKNVLLYLGKFPGYGFDIDGGSILAKQLIDTLKTRCNLDLVFIRKNKEVYNDFHVRQIRYVDYKNALMNKFIRRLDNLDTNKEAIGDYHKYDTLITAHVSKFFGFQDMPESFWERTILFPMFCTSSYVRAGESVPFEYTEQERFVFAHVHKIICPSTTEKMDISRDYNIDRGRIIVIPRGINPVFSFTNRPAPKQHIHIACIGSIKKQKNNIDALKVLYMVRSHGISADLHLICTIQEKSVHEEMQSYIENHDLKKYVHYHIGLPQAEVADLMKSMDVNISVSNWETFGRGIFEGISSGLPTFVYNRLSGVKDICQGCEGVSFTNNAKEMANSIIATISNEMQYNNKVASLAEIAKKVSYEKEQKSLLSAIL